MKPIIISKMEKTDGPNNQVHVVQDKSTPQCLIYIVCVLILGLVAGILVLSVLIYENTKDIQRLQAHGVQDYHFPALSHPKFGRYHKLMDRMTKDVTFHITSTGKTITENIVITEKEEIITTFRATLIFDYSNVVHDKSTPRCLLYTVCAVILGLVAGILVLSVLIYENTKDIQRLQGHVQDYHFPALSHPKFGRYHKLMDRMTKDVTFHITSSGKTITENIVITEKEEIITTFRATLIFDYSNGWLVTKVSGAGTNPCFISELRRDGSIDNEKESLDKIKGDVTVNEDDVIYTKYKSTNRVVDAAMLSPTAASMCEQSRLVWFTASKKLTKRQAEGEFTDSEDSQDTEFETITMTITLPDGTVQTITYNPLMD